MPYVDPVRQREYARNWIANRRAQWFADKCCDECGSTEDLQLDHIDPAEKADHRIWSWSQARREAELAKCRPLCKICHQRKSATEAARGVNHGHVKLTEDDVRAIRASELNNRILAVIYGVHYVTIGKIKRRIKWKHIELHGPIVYR